MPQNSGIRRIWCYPAPSYPRCRVGGGSKKKFHPVSTVKIVSLQKFIGGCVWVAKKPVENNNFTFGRIRVPRVALLRGGPAFLQYWFWWFCIVNWDFGMVFQFFDWFSEILSDSWSWTPFPALQTLSHRFGPFWDNRGVAKKFWNHSDPPTVDLPEVS